MLRRFARTLLYLVACAVPGVSAANEFVDDYVLGKYYVSTVPDDAFEKTPLWAEDAENPPLSAKKAAKLATGLRESLVPDQDDIKWRVRSVELRPLDDNPFESPTKKWFWVVTFWRINTKVSGRSTKLRLIVLMDGRVVEPEIQIRERRASEEATK